MRRILRSTVLMGLAAVVGSAAGIVRLKVFALLLGPSGLGLLAILQSITGTLATLTDFGLGGAATRELARVREQPQRALALRRAVLLLAAVFGSAGAAVLWTLRRPVAALVLGNEENALAVGILALAILMSTLAGARFGILAAYRLVARSAVARIGAALVGSAAAILIVARQGASGLPWAVVAVQATLAGAAWLAEPPANPVTGTDSLPRFDDAKALMRLGGAVVVAALATAATEMAVRALLARWFGLEVAGEYQAAWSLSMLVTGLALGALAIDFYPAASARAEAGEPVLGSLESQLGLSLLLAAPVLLFLVSYPEFVTRLFYTEEFAATPEIVRWQVSGDALRLAAWVQGTTLLAYGRIRGYLVTVVMWNACYLAAVTILLRTAGPTSLGLALGLSYLPMVPCQAFLLRRDLEGVARRGLALGALLAMVLAATAAIHTWLPAARPLALAVAVVFATWCLWKLLRGVTDEQAVGGDTGR